MSVCEKVKLLLDKLITELWKFIITLICENHLASEPFIYLRVSSLFFLKNLASFDVDQKEKMAGIYLSAESADMFKEVRGKGKIDFNPYRIA